MSKFAEILGWMTLHAGAFFYRLFVAYKVYGMLGLKFGLLPIKGGMFGVYALIVLIEALGPYRFPEEEKERTDKEKAVRVAHLYAQASVIWFIAYLVS